MKSIGALAGLILAIGALMLMAAWRNRRPSFVDRVAPYVAPTSVSVSTSGVERLVTAAARDASGWLDYLGSTTTTVRRRLDLLGRSSSVEAFRLEQLTWGCIGLAIGLALATTLALMRGVATLPLVLAVLVCAVGGALARDRALTQQVQARTRQIAAELPTVAELLALAVGAGESPTAAMDRVARSTQGAMSQELERVLGEMRAGASVGQALGDLGRRTQLPALARFADGVAVAIERGSPLADVLRAQAGDARTTAKQELMETGGKREIAMLVPVVILILPLTVLFALFPGLALLEGGMP